MAFLEFRNVVIAGIAASVPKTIASNLHPQDSDSISSDYSPEAFVETTGVLERRVSEKLTTSDLCYEAAEHLIGDLNWDKNDIEAIIFVSQTADYVLPATACILQDRLGLTKDCYAEDVSLGCSGWVYGLSNVASLVSTGSIKKALLLAGDAKARSNGPLDPLFGFAGTATAIEFVDGADSFKFHFGTDGSGYDAIIIPDGGSRNQVSEHSLDIIEVEGRRRNRLQTQMNGMDVFSFGITTAPKSVKKLAEHFGFNYLDADYVLFHQANMKMNNQIVKKLKLDPKQTPSCMYHFGNTSSASIPLTIVTKLKGAFEDRRTSFICCGFGVGLSWGTVAFVSNKMVVSELIEVEEPKEESKWI